MAQIKLEQVTRTFGPRAQDNRKDEKFEETDHEEAATIYALEQVTLTVPDGKATVVIGPSGCGKSTLLRVVAGLDTEYTGRVYYDDREMSDIAPGERDIGMVFQNYALYPHFPGQGNLRFTFWVRKAPDAEAEERIRATAEMMGFGFNQLLPRKPGTLSGGQQQRLAIARALVRNPSLFLLDEPLASLDAKLRAQTRVEIKRLLRRFAITTIYVTHDQEEAIALADQIAVMRKGKIEQVGAPAYLRSEPANIFVAGFFGAYPMNLMEGQVDADGRLHIGPAHLPLPQSVVQKAERGQSLTLGARPEDLGLVWGVGQEAKGPHLRGSVLTVEPDFARRIQYARIETEVGMLTVAETDPEPLPLNQNVAVILPETPRYFFDTQSEARL